MDLDGIASAHGDVGLCVAEQVGEITARAGATVRIASNADGLKVTGPNITGDEPAM